MHDLSFFTPVCVKTGDNVQMVGSVRDVLQFLSGWPPDRRGPALGCALKSAEAAIAGQLSVEQVRQAFVSFAGITGILAKTDAATMRGGAKELVEKAGAAQLSDKPG